MPDYNFENLGPKDFEELTNALGTAYIGHGLRPFGVGADGGREATFHGKMSYPSTAKPWRGYLVMQCKQKQSLGATRKLDADWAIAQLNADMKVYQNQEEPRQIPDYYIFVTNVILSPKLKTGGKDRFVAKLEEWATTLGIKGVDVWDRDKLSRLLDSKQDIAKRFGFLHAGDLIHRAVEQVLAQDEKLKNTIAVFLEAELRSDQYVRLTQAGHVGDDQTPLARVFVDLQAIEHDDNTETEKFYVVKAVQQVSDCPLRPSLFEANRKNKAKKKPNVSSNYPAWEDYSRFVFIGGPGQGKTTLAQHLAQRHRAAILSSKSFDKLERDTHGILRVIRESAIASGTGLPTHPRIPFRIVLEQFADALAKQEVHSVLDYIAAVISKRTTINFAVSDVEKLLSETPWFIAFDGLDEVPAASNRTEVLNAVSLFLSLARQIDADILVVATTRPQGYEGEFAPAHFNHVKLIYLDKREALAYAQKFVDAKYAADVERRERIMQRLRTAAEEDATARLMISPLQVTIMAALVDLVGNPPRERYPLFNRYYDIVYQREQERGLEFSDVLADYRGPIDALHDHIGLVLQVEAEKAGSAQSKISKERLEGFIRTHLIDEGYEGNTLESITASILKVALLRLVFIVPLEDARYGFEVRSLQEFAAARALMQGKYDKVKHRLRIIAPVPYWRNTVLFAVGRAFAERDEQQCDMLTQLCRELNDVDIEPVIARILAGSRLALDILEDGVVDRRPKYRHLFLEMAFELLAFEFDDAPGRLSEQYLLDNKARYIKHVQDAISTGKQMAVSELLSYLIDGKKLDDLAWAEETLKNIWPIEFYKSKQLFEILSKHLTWNDWQLEKVEDIARNSDLDWVTRNLADHVPIPWIRDSRNLLIHKGRHMMPEKESRIRLNIDKKSFSYLIGSNLPSKGYLDELSNAKPIHQDWLPFIAGNEFILHQTPANLANALDTLADTFDSNLYFDNSNLPWPLAVLLHVSSSKEELRHQSKRLRAGELGTPADWIAAEQRWLKKGFFPIDFSIFDNEEWPFSAKVSERGVVPFPLVSLDNFDQCKPTVDILHELFKATKNKLLRITIAKSLMRYISILPIITGVKLPQISFSDICELTQYSNTRLDPSLLIEIISSEDDFDFVQESESLNKLGHFVDLEPYYAPMTKERIQLGSKIISNFTALISGKKPREGILRLLVSFAVFGIQIPQISISGTNLSKHGKLLLNMLLLLNKNTSVSEESLAEQIIESWTLNGVDDGEADAQQVTRNLDRDNTLSNYTLNVLSLLLASPILDSKSKEGIADTIIQQNRYRTSGLVASDNQVTFDI